MPNWTEDQTKAIQNEGKNIIVSAGAGSGKTAVLTERVLRKLREGVNINELLILTFTKAAAQEMKDRIRKEIRKDSSLKRQLELIDASYITTFDSFALSILKKYHYLKNISPNISVADASLIKLEKEKIIDNVFDNLYKEENKQFLKLIKDFCVKDDTEIKNYILSIDDKLGLQINQNSYIETYKEKYMSKDKIDLDIKKYVLLIEEKIEELKDATNKLSLLCDGAYIEKIYDVLNPLLNSKTYDEFVQNMDIKLPSLPRGSEEEIKKAKEKINDIIKEIKSMCHFSNEEEIYNKILLTYDYVTIIFDIVKKIDNALNTFKQKNNFFEFNDIIKMSINIIECNPSVKLEIKNSLKEIMIDEYQDTNDLQEYFISLISNNNVYMVGDIKQSIYRFRNANPNIFKSKYDKYSFLDGGEKIDLNKNFRSRNEVLKNINLIFDNIMTDSIGGADYTNGHQMVFGNNTYEINKPNQNYHMDIYTYDLDKKSSPFTEEEIEFFFVAHDIKEKIDNHFQVFDKDLKTYRDITYNDFVILMDKSTSFVLAKKILEYNKIPLIICRDDIITENYDLLVIRNIIRLAIKQKNNEYDTEYKYLFVSLARSFIFEYSDEQIFKLIKEDKYRDDLIINKIKNIIVNIDNQSISDFLNVIINEFNLEENYIKIGDINNCLIRLEYLFNTAESLENIGYTIYDFNKYLSDITEKKYDIKVASSESGSGVKIMTIHKSKGLEFPICYFVGMNKSFNMHDIKEKFILTNNYGLIAPYYENGIGQTIYMDLLKNDYLVDEISEKIRLLYVALTRAKEKIIIVVPNTDKQINSIKKCKSFANFLTFIDDKIDNFKTKIDIDSLNISKLYNNVKIDNYQSKLSNSGVILEKQILNTFENSTQNEKFSKNIHSLISYKDKQNMEYGIKFHEILEMIDFKNPSLDVIKEAFMKNKVIKFLNNDILKNLDDATIYKESEFMYEKDNILYHGIIDLMLERNDTIDIIDYKLMHTTDDAYLKQLNGYKEYIKNIKCKKVNTYLYSIIDEKLIKLD